ncbi:glycosyltransferase family protein [Streptomyces jeddahensis]|uniref:glycosyltransferase family protein n=1 Tax=Streptomyces jeddahensis TaxID=1716141 RepID=UPI0012FF78F8|nr:hypothetical protein [Streptomyces jeddahensis]
MTNDRVLDHNVSFGRGFAALCQEGLIRHHAVAPSADALRHGPARALRELADVAGEIRPDVMFVQPIGSLPWTDDYLAALLRRAGSPHTLFWEGDAICEDKARRSHRLVWYRASDTVCATGLGATRRVLSRFTRRSPRYVPNVVPGRLLTPAPIPPIAEAVHDAVQIGGLYLRFGLYEGVAGARERRRTVQGVRRLPGCRTAVYGTGWRGRGALGPLPYDAQVSTLRRARFSFSWSHFPGRLGEFSDRLPISMYAGRPHIGTRPGPVGWLPGRDQGLLLADSPAEAVALARELLGTDDATLDAMGRALHEWVRDRLTERNALLHMLGPILGLPAPPADPWDAITAMETQDRDGDRVHA